MRRPMERFEARTCFSSVAGTLATGAAEAALSLASVTVTAFGDPGGDGVKNPGDGPMQGLRVFFDLNRNGTRQKREPQAFTDGAGVATIDGLTPGPQATLRVEAPPTEVRLTIGAQVRFGAIWLDAGEALALPAPFTPRAGVSGRVFYDRNRNGSKARTEPAMAGVFVYLDANNNGKHDAAETSTLTDANGYYWFDALPPDHPTRIRVQPTRTRKLITGPGRFGYLVPAKDLPIATAVLGLNFGLR